MTLDKYIYQLRTLIKEHSDDSIFSDQLLSDYIISTRAELLTQIEMKKHHQSIFNYQTFCMPLICEDLNSCDGCLTSVGPLVLKSTYNLPRTINSRNHEVLKVLAFNGKELSYVTPWENEFNLHSITRKHKPSFYVQNNRLIILNNLNFKAILVRGIFENPMDLSKIKICSSEGIESELACFDPLEHDFPMDASLANTMLEIILKKILLVSKQIPDDTTNNANS